MKMMIKHKRKTIIKILRESIKASRISGTFAKMMMIVLSSHRISKKLIEANTDSNGS